MLPPPNQIFEPSASPDVHAITRNMTNRAYSRRTPYSKLMRLLSNLAKTVMADKARVVRDIHNMQI